MAANNSKNDAGADKETQAKGSGSKKMILIVAVVTLVAILVSAGVTWFLLSGGKKHEAAAEADKAAQEHAQAEKPKKALYLDIEPAFVVTYNDNNRQRYMQVYVTLMAREEKAINLAKLHMPVIKYELNLLFSSQTFASLQTDEGKQALREACTKKVNEILEKEEKDTHIEQALFTNFVMQ